MPGTGRPFPAGQKCTPKGLATTSTSTVLTVSLWTRRAPTPTPRFNAYSEWVWWQAGRPSEGANFATRINGKTHPSPLFPSPLSYSICQLVRLLNLLEISSRCSDGSFSHTASSVRILRPRRGYQWLQKRGTQGHSSEKPSAAGIDPEQGQPSSKLPLPLKLPRSCIVDFLPFVLATSAAEQRLHMHM
jgi:hypothetical protein